MKRDELIALAREAGWTGIYTSFISPTEKVSITIPVTIEQIERFANLVAAKEREECAKVCDELGKQFRKPDYVATYLTCSSAIRARKP